MFVLLGIRLRSGSLRELVGRTWTSLKSAIEDISSAAVFCLVVIAVGVAWYLVFGKLSRQEQSVSPITVFDMLAWIPVAISTGIVEEFVFRGYLLKQAYALMPNMTLAIALQAVIFSLGHGYHQTLSGLGYKFILGVLFGVLAHRLKGLLPGIISHSFLDFLSGLTGFLSGH